MRCGKMAAAAPSAPAAGAAGGWGGVRRRCQRLLYWVPVLFISSILCWSYYAYVTQLCLRECPRIGREREEREAARDGGVGGRGRCPLFVRSATTPEVGAAARAGGTSAVSAPLSLHSCVQEQGILPAGRERYRRVPGPGAVRAEGLKRRGSPYRWSALQELPGLPVRT